MIDIETILKRRMYVVRNRCHNPNHKDYKNYGGRGIKITEEWLGYKIGTENFVRWGKSSGFKPELTLERINNDGGYSPENCKWGTRKEQANNKRIRKFTFGGKAQTIQEWANEYNVSYGCMYTRIMKRHNPGKYERYIYNGKTVIEAAGELGIDPDRIGTRIRQLGWSIERAFTTPKLVALKRKPREKHLIEYTPIEQKLTYLYDTRIHRSPCGSTNMKAMYRCGYCGKETEKFKMLVKNRSIKSCGCMMSKKQYPNDYVPIDSWLIFIKRTNRKNEKSYALYKCKCGNETEKQMCLVKSGTTRSCGCMNKTKILWS